MNGMRIIGFAGLAGSGKTTAAQYLEQTRGFVRVPFAEPLKRMALALGLTKAEVFGHLKELPSPLLGYKTPRQFMQLLGTEFGRVLIDESLWIRAWERRVIEIMDHPDVLGVVADDVRFPNEVAIIQDLGGKVFAIDNPLAGSKSGAAHASENTPLVVDGRIANDGDNMAAFLSVVSALVSRSAELNGGRDRD